jgi:hypothetical protein
MGGIVDVGDGHLGKETSKPAGGGLAVPWKGETFRADRALAHVAG